VQNVVRAGAAGARKSSIEWLLTRESRVKEVSRFAAVGR
jgi:hypothetical protein